VFRSDAQHKHRYLTEVSNYCFSVYCISTATFLARTIHGVSVIVFLFHLLIWHKSGQTNNDVPIISYTILPGPQAKQKSLEGV